MKRARLIPCANGCGCYAAKDRDICIVCVVASDGRCKREPEEPMGQMWLPLKECG